MGIGFHSQIAKQKSCRSNNGNNDDDNGSNSDTTNDKNDDNNKDDEDINDNPREIWNFSRNWFFLSRHLNVKKRNSGMVAAKRFSIRRFAVRLWVQWIISEPMLMTNLFQFHVLDFSLFTPCFTINVQLTKTKTK